MSKHRSSSESRSSAVRQQYGARGSSYLEHLKASADNRLLAEVIDEIEEEAVEKADQNTSKS